MGGAYNIYVLQIAHILHLAFDKFENNTGETGISSLGLLSYLIDTTHLWRFCSALVIPALISSPTRLCHSNLAVGPLHIAFWNVCSTHAACKFLNACTASMRKSASGLPSAVSFAMASSTFSYRCRCSDGRFRNTLSSILRASGWRFAF